MTLFDYPKTLYLVRHAKSSWGNPGLSDAQRPLNGRGNQAAPEMGQRLAAQGCVPDHIIASQAVRAQSTARHLAAALDYPAANIGTEPDLYFTGLGGLLDTIERADDSHGSLMLVGHNPTMTDAMNTLAGTNIHNMPTCAIAVIGFDMESWGLVRSTDGILLGYDYPKGPGSFLPG